LTLLNIASAEGVRAHNHAQRQDILQLISTMDEKRWRLSFFLASDILIGNFAEVRII
jgi:hypothetical protein